MRPPSLAVVGAEAGVLEGPVEVEGAEEEVAVEALSENNKKRMMFIFKSMTLSLMMLFASFTKNTSM